MAKHKGSWRFFDALRSALRPRAKADPRKGPLAADASFRLMYERFREILVHNDTILELIADIEDRLAGRVAFSLDAVERRVRGMAMDVFVMVKNVNQLGTGRHGNLYDALRRIDAELEGILAEERQVPGPMILRLAGLRGGDAPLAGNKMANLGEVAAACGFEVPAGFAITTAATARLLDHAGLWERCERLEGVLELEGPAALGDACAEVQAAVCSSHLPGDLAGAIHEAWADSFPRPGTLVAMRSSALGEDSLASSHAGLYATELRVDMAGLIDAYRVVIASSFCPAAVTYRFQRGLPLREALMAVGCLEMVEPRCSGILYSRPPDDPEAEAVVIGATRGLAARLAAGEDDAEYTVVVPGSEVHTTSDLLTGPDLASLSVAARRLEAHFGAPQDVEWAIRGDRSLVILQARPLVTRRKEPDAPGEPARGAVLLAGGYVACPGVGAGPVAQVREDGDLATFPDGAVLVARHSSPVFSQVMERCVAIVTDVGSPTGHMASLAREFDVPAIVGLTGATETLAAGDLVTVDAGALRVYAGVPQGGVAPRRRRPLADSLAVARLRRIATLVTPLRLTDPGAPEFTPEGCRSLHDITRFVHEKAYEVMFHYGDLAVDDRQNSKRLEARLPIQVRVFDVGGGVVERTAHPDRVRPDEIVSAPLRAFLAGMLEERIRWYLPRPVSIRGFLSVLGETLAGPPAEALQIGRLSYAIVSDRYLNFSTKAGYHFSTVDAYCGMSQNKNYVHFRFAGGAADSERRERRVRFLSTVLEALDFKVRARGDLLTARLDKYGFEAIQARLLELGHLSLCARQLDMLMDSDGSPDYFAQAFLAGEWEKF